VRHSVGRTPGWAAWPVVGDFEQRYPFAYAAELESFARCVRDDLPPKVTGLDALAAFDLARAAEAAWRAGRPVELTPTRTPDGVVYEQGA
jgi:predicted dehydrogenase